ncbi:hypothetical protein ACFLU4_06735 [Chloroflexota bacterium]
MPGNIIQINASKKLEWYVGDSKMDTLIAYLDKIGSRNGKKPKVRKVISSDVSS